MAVKWWWWWWWWREGLKIYGFNETLSTICLKQISVNQKYLISKNKLQLGNCYAFPKCILYACQRSFKFEYLHNSLVYNMSDDAVYCTDCAMFLSAWKQRSFCKKIFFLNLLLIQIKGSVQNHTLTESLDPSVKILSVNHSIIHHKK